MSPMSTAAMNAVDRAKAGVASGVLSMSRMVGGTFGVAAIGALVAGVGRSKINDSLPHLPAATRAHLAESLGGGGGGGHHVPAQVTSALHEAFISALGSGMRLSGAVAFVGAIVAFAMVRTTTHQQAAAPEGAEALDALAA
jgi:hypothetical protein